LDIPLITDTKSRDELISNVGLKSLLKPYQRFGNTFQTMGRGPLELRLETDKAEEQDNVSHVVKNMQDITLLNLELGEWWCPKNH
jgi:hypothetical protein